ncbi:hypothetical protein EDB85DRAFT_880094 [Lactarius pseudohatsudake]|nr:hypothetical protein EDB85DRAFT_880094 [Lactarius pseudohatsudake]
MTFGARMQCTATASERREHTVLIVPTPTPSPVLDDKPLAGSPLSSDSPMTGPDHAYSSPESHSSVLTPASPPRPTSVPDLGVVTEDGGNPKTGLLKDKDIRDSPVREDEDITANPDLPSQLQLLPSVTGVPISDPSLRSRDTKHTGDRPPHPSDSQYDIV